MALNQPTLANAFEWRAASERGALRCKGVSPAAAESSNGKTGPQRARVGSETLAGDCSGSTSS